jgi:diadenosine tetraphosphatase ApaH/serine/threonine PP2A family protein phosphatase
MDVDQFISDCLEHKDLSESDMICILRIAQEILFEEGTLLNISLPMTICGDIHGQFYDLKRLFQIGGHPDSTRYLFLGDYVDRGYYSLETFALLIAYKVKYPDTFFMIRGNHESRSVNTMYGFYDEIVSRYGHSGVWKMCNETFDMLPMAALIENIIYCVHGGLSPEIRMVEQLAELERRQEIQPTGPISDLCWSDPEEIVGWGKNMRGAGWLFGKRPAHEFCHNNRVKLIVRAHQLMNDGYHYHYGGDFCVTVWSAPNYMYRAGNMASVLKVSEQQERKFLQFAAVPLEQRRVPPDRLSPYFL